MEESLYGSIDLINVSFIPPKGTYGKIEWIEELTQAINYVDFVFNKINCNGRLEWEAMVSLYEAFKEKHSIDYTLRFVLKYHPTLISIVDSHRQKYVIKRPRGEYPRNEKIYTCFACGYWTVEAIRRCPKCGRYNINKFK